MSFMIYWYLKIIVKVGTGSGLYEMIGSVMVYLHYVILYISCNCYSMIYPLCGLSTVRHIYYMIKSTLWFIYYMVYLLYSISTIWYIFSVVYLLYGILLNGPDLPFLELLLDVTHKGLEAGLQVSVQGLHLFL